MDPGPIGEAAEDVPFQVGQGVAGPLAHLAEARSVVHPSIAETKPDATWIFAVKMSQDLGPDVIRWRKILLAEIEQLIEDMAESINEWWESRGICITFPAALCICDAKAIGITASTRANE